jgi:alkylation response protein AidB-like acyl-CoA dehydrogenase
MDFYQDPPRIQNLFEQDTALQRELTRRIPADLMKRVRPVLEKMGRLVVEEVKTLGEEAEAHPPVHIPYDPWGKRIDEIRVSGAWNRLKEFAAKHNLVSTGYDESLGDRKRVVQAALLHLFCANSATYSCPLAMTDAAARVLLDIAPAPLRDRLAPQLISTAITSGQWMTERTGGSDVSETTTVARKIDGDRYALSGVKWFTSSVTSEMALTLAKIEGSEKLSLFCVEVADGGIEVNRLKEKLGTRALPTAELTLKKTPATLIGEEGRGVANISGMLNITRYYNAVASTSAMSYANLLAGDYSQRRKVFGKPLIDHPLHRRTLEDLECTAAAGLALVFEVADLLGKSEEGTATKEECQRLRGLVPVAKLTLGKQVVAQTSEMLECFGGAGYIEDTGLPRLLRDAQVLPIWEGTTNVLSLDLFRAERKESSLTLILDNLKSRASGVLLEKVDQFSSWLNSGDPKPEEEARRIALTTGHLCEAVYLRESLSGGTEAFDRFIQTRL